MLAPPEGGKEASPSFLEFRAIEPFDPPALLAGTGTADAFGVVSDLAAGLSKKRICIGIDCLHLLHLGESNPRVLGCFLPCVGFSEMGWDTYPTPEEKAAHRGDSGFDLANYEHYGNFTARIFARTARFPRAEHTKHPAPYRE